MRYNFFNTRNSLLILVLLWLFIQVGVYYHYGVQSSIDTQQYLADAQQLQAGTLPTGRSVWYLSYSTFLALVFSMGGSLPTVVLLQMLLSGVAAICLYKLTQEIYQRNFTAWLAVLLYLLWIKIHEWDTFVYTESFFTSMSIISFAMLVKSKNVWQYVIAGSLITIMFFIRPTGLPFLFAMVWYLLKRYPTPSRTVMIPVAVILLAGGLFLLNAMMHSYPVIESYVQSEIIYPKISLGLEPTQGLTIPAEDYPPLIRLALFILFNPVHFAKLFAIKFLLFVGNVKPYFSPWHNAIIVLVLYPLYALAVKGYLAFPRERKEKYFIVAFFLMQACIVAVTSENWDGRFLIPLLPFVFVLSAGGIDAVLVTVKSHLRK